MKKILIILLFLFIEVKSIGQNLYTKEGVAPTTPIAASLMMYNDIPVAYNTGVPDISIPLYTIQVGDFSLPIVLRYHLRSVKPGSSETNVALGWTLHYGGLVTRTIFGKGDEECQFWSPYREGSGTSNNEKLKFLHEKYYYNWDSEKDIFSYSIIGGSGEFVLSDNGPLQLGKNSVDIQVNSLAWDFGSTNNIEITNDKGVKFEFGFGGGEPLITDREDYVTSWNLYQIELPTSQTIDFKYTGCFNEWITSESNHVIIRDKQEGMQTSLWPDNDILNICERPDIYGINAYSDQNVFEKNISRIKFPNGLIKFILSPDNKIITGIQIFGQDTINALKRYVFDLSSSNYMSNMKLLRKIIEMSSASDTVGIYNFEYYDEGLIGKNANTDYWGYYNGGDIGGNFAPANTYEASNTLNINACDAEHYYNYQYSGRSKEPSINSKKNTLKKIYYPTKGSIEFLYELNVLKGGGVERIGNGLRVSKIIENDNFGSFRARVFTYTPYNNYSYIFSGITDVASTSYYIGRYDFICENCNGANNTGFAKYRNVDYSSQVPYRTLQLMDANYSSVIESVEDVNGNKLGKTQYNFEYNNHDFSGISGMVPQDYLYVGPVYRLGSYKGWDSGLLVATNVFDSNNNLVKSTTYDYTYHFVDTIQNTFVNQISFYPGDFEDDSLGREWLLYQRNTLGGEFLSFSLPDVYSYYNYNIISGWAEKTNETETFYFGETPTTKTTAYEYNGLKKYYPSDIILTNSDGSERRKGLKYPFDKQAQVYYLMTDKNIISFPIEQEEYLNDVLIKADLTEYSIWNSSLFMPSASYTKTQGQDYKLRNLYHSYDDKGNILSMSKEDDIKYVYIWGYNQSHPVIAATNIEYSSLYSIVDNIQSDLENFLLSLGNLENENQKNALRSFFESLRNSLPQNAQARMYTYTPLIGVTSQTDENGVTTYYEYDSSGRLSYIKDNNGNLLKTYTYYYKQN